MSSEFVKKERKKPWGRYQGVQFKSSEILFSPHSSSQFVLNKVGYINKYFCGNKIKLSAFVPYILQKTMYLYLVYESKTHCICTWYMNQRHTVYICTWWMNQRHTLFVPGIWMKNTLYFYLVYESKTHCI